MMTAAFSFWNGRIAPVFDVARQVILMEFESGRLIREIEKDLRTNNPGGKAKRLAKLGVDTLVCGAVSRFMHDLITFQGITVVSFVSGDLREVIRAWEENRINEADFAMPGCCSRFHRRAGCTTRQRELYFCPRCGHEMRCGKVVHVMGRVCPRCGSIMLKGHGWLRGK